MTNAKPFFTRSVKVIGVVDEARKYMGHGETAQIALRNAKKSARAFIRRHGLTVRAQNCECSQKSSISNASFIFTDLEVPRVVDVDANPATII